MGVEMLSARGTACDLVLCPPRGCPAPRWRLAPLARTMPPWVYNSPPATLLHKPPLRPASRRRSPALIATLPRPPTAQPALSPQSAKFPAAETQTTPVDVDGRQPSRRPPACHRPSTAPSPSSRRARRDKHSARVNIAYSAQIVSDVRRRLRASNPRRCTNTIATSCPFSSRDAVRWHVHAPPRLLSPDEAVRTGRGGSCREWHHIPSPEPRGISRRGFDAGSCMRKNSAAHRNLSHR